jgi:FtsK/SpoIIIE family/TIR domain/FtsK alpha domain
MDEIHPRSLRVFLCHASDDKPIVRLLYNRLIQDGIDVWLDEEKILPGKEWNLEIQKAVRESDVVIICLSRKSVTKEGYVQKEIRLALDVADEKPEDTIFIIPARLEECVVPERLSHWQWINLFSEHKGSDRTEYENLLKSLKFREKQLNEKGIVSQFRTYKQFIPNKIVGMPPRAWIYPRPEEILNPPVIITPNTNNLELLARKIEKTLYSLGVPSQVVQIDSGPRFIRFGIVPLFRESENGSRKIRIAEIEGVINDVALELRAQNIFFEPNIPGRNYAGIYVQNKEIVPVSLLRLLTSEYFRKRQTNLSIVLGEEMSGTPAVIDLLSSPNILVAGMEGAGKSTLIDDILSCLLINNSPNELRIVFIDTRKIEFSAFDNIPHLLSPSATELEDVIATFDYLAKEVGERQHLFARSGTRNVLEYNKKAEFNEKIPYIFVAISELSDLMAEVPEEIERYIVRLASMARITGINILISTQRPTAGVVTNRIIGHFTNRIAFKTLTEADSQIIIDCSLALKLLGQGDMLCRSSGRENPTRVQGAQVSQDEIFRLVDFWWKQVIC